MEQILSDKIRSANVLLTVVIVMLHSTWPGPYALGIIQVLCVCAVPSFFTISSFLYFRNGNPSPREYLGKLRQRLVSLLVPFVAFNLIFMLWKAFSAGMLGQQHVDAVPTEPWAVLSYIAGCKADGPLWYVRELMVFVVFAPVIGWMVGRSRMAVVVLFAGGVVFSRTSYDCIVHWIPCLALGCHCALYKEDARRILGKVATLPPPIIFTSVAVFLTAACVAFGNEPSRTATPPFYVYRMLTPFALIAVYAKCDPLPRRAVRVLSPCTFFIYCTHFIVTGTLKTAGQTLVPGCPAPLLYACVCIAAISITAGGAMAVRRIAPLWKILNGGR